MSEQQNTPPSPRTEVERFQEAIDYVRRFTTAYVRFDDRFATVLSLAQERVAELSRRAEAAEQDEIAWRAGP